MRGSRFIMALGIFVFILSPACQKSEKAQTVEFSQAEAPEAVQEEAVETGSQLLFTLDGSLKDWTGIEPFWVEGGAAGRGAFESNIDIKQVFFKNDGHYLYVFLQITPTIEDRFKISTTGGRLGDLYIDTDANPNSGSGPVGGFKAEKYRGYEKRIYLPIGIMSSPDKKFPYVACEVRPLEGNDFSPNAAARWESNSEGSFVAHGPDGIEFALPLDILGLSLPATVRVLLAEHSHWDEEQGYTVGELRLEAAK